MTILFLYNCVSDGYASVCITTNGKFQPIVFDNRHRLVFPIKSCVSGRHPYCKSGELFRNVRYVGCAGDRNHMSFDYDAPLLLVGDPPRNQIGDSACLPGGERILDTKHRSFNVSDRRFRSLKCSHKHKPRFETKFTDHRIASITVQLRLDDANIRNVYAVNWNMNENRPNWVKHVPTFSDTELDDKGIRTTFWSSPEEKIGRSNNFRKGFAAAYLHHSLDRGHLAPVNDFLLASERLATFSLLNAVPQPKKHNRGTWKRHEDEFRSKILDYRQRYGGDDMYILTTPLYNDTRTLINGFLPVPYGINKTLWVTGRGVSKVLHHVYSIF